ncbi:hypothetical protein EEB12_29275 [Rhodococcus sp. WS1]|nr:hypothetical protein EEB12_29275 [Rhodococcus sp. WS1]
MVKLLRASRCRANQHEFQVSMIIKLSTRTTIYPRFDETHRSSCITGAVDNRKSLSQSNFDNHVVSDAHSPFDTS